MNALFLKDLGQKVRRGLEGRVRDGRSGGGLSYGYSVVREVDARGEPVRGGRRINENEAIVVRRIFAEFAAGKSPRAIAHSLNAAGIAGPGGRPWGDTTIRGHHLRRTGLLRNDLYVGRLIWNKLRYLKAQSAAFWRHEARPYRADSEINAALAWQIAVASLPTQHSIEGHALGAGRPARALSVRQC